MSQKKNEQKNSSNEQNNSSHEPIIVKMSAK